MRYRSAVGMYMATAVAMVGLWLMGADSVLAGTPRVKSAQLGTVQGVPAPAPMLRSIEPAEVVGIGGKIRLRGTNLGTAQTAVVVFHPGVIAEQVERHTPNEIVVRVPVGAQTGNIQVVTGVTAAALRSLQTQIGVIEGCETPVIQAQVAQYKTQQIFMLSFGRFSNPIRRFVTAAYMHPKPSIRPVIDEVDGVKLVRNRLIVDLKDFLSFDVALQIADQLNAELVGHFPITNSYVLDLRQTPKHLKELDALMARVAQDQRVAEVWHDIVLEPRQVRFAVVDVVDRYRHTRDNPPLHGREDAWATDRIQAPGAWNLIERFIGRNNLRHVKVAVVDTGCDQTHPEFNGVQLVKVETTLVRVRIAGREVILPQAAAFTERPYDLGDDAWDRFDEDRDGIRGNDLVQHGTMVTSLIGARNGNVIDGATGDLGINGLLHNPMPYTIQVYRFWEDLLEAPAEESVTGLLAAINTAAITGANVMNASLSTIPLRPGHLSRPDFERSLRKIAHQLMVFQNRLLVVIAAGNDAEGGEDTNSGEIEPFEDLNLNLQLDRDAGEDLNGNDRPDFGNHIAASLGTLPNVIAVGAIGGPDHDPGPGRSWGRDDQRAEFSNWSAVRDAGGFDAVVQLAAPGTDVFMAGRSFLFGRDFSFQIGGAHFVRSDGTSFAAPLVTGSAALLKAIDPTLTPAQLKQRLLDSAFAVNTTDSRGRDLKWRTLKVGYAVRQLLVDRRVIGNDQPWTGVSKVVYDGLRMFEIRRGPDGRAQAFADRALAGLFGYSPSLAHHGTALIWIADERTIKQHVFSTGATGNFTVLNPPHTLTRILEAAPNLRYLFGVVTPDGDCNRRIQVHVGADVVADTGWYNICPSGIFGDRNWQHYFLHKGAWRPDNRAWALDYYHANGRGNTTNQECRAWWGDNPFPGGPLGFPGCTGTEFRYPAWAPEGRAYAGAEGARLRIAYYNAAHEYQFTWAVGDWPYPPILWLNWSPDGSELGVLGGNTLYTVRRDIRTPADRDPRPLRTIGNVVFTWQW
jgi:subtilisin family serine protease